MSENSRTFSFERIAQNTLVLFAGRLLAGAAYLLTMTMLARMLGVSDYGKFIISFTYVSFFSHLSMFGIDTVLIREISRDPTACSRLISCGMLIKFAFSLIAILLACAPLPFVDLPEQLRLLVAIFLVPLLFNSLRTPRVVFEAHMEACRSMSVELAGRILTLVLIAGAMLFGFSLEKAALTYVLSELPSLWLLYKLSKKHFSFALSFDSATVKYLVSESWQIALMSFLIAVYFRIDTLMLSFYQGDTAVGIYNAAYLVLTSLMLAPDAYVRSIFPAMSNSYNRNMPLLRTTFLSSLKYLATLGLWVVVIGFLFSHEIIALLFGDTYRSSSDALRVLIIASGILFISPLVSNTLTAINKQAINLYLCLINVAVNVTLNLVLIPRCSYMGASLATLAAEGLGCTLALCCTLKYLGLSHNPGVIFRHARVLAPAAGSFLLFPLLKEMNPIAAAALVSLTYGIGIFLVKWFDADDLSRMKRLMRGWV